MIHRVTIRPIESEDDFDAAIERIGQLMNSPKDSPERAEMNVLVTLAKEYERVHHPLPPADPVEAVRFVMDRKGLKPADLVPFFGAQSRVSDFLNRKRGLSMEQVRRLHRGLGVPFESLLAD